MNDLPGKGELRAEVATRRQARPQPERDAAAAELAERVLGLPELAAARTVAAYVSFPTEPGTVPLREALRDRGVRVLLPVLREDKDLDWAAAGQVLDVDAVRTAEVVICPAVAVSADGYRLGRGGGSYDRVLARVHPSTLTVALVHDDEVVEALPIQPHDRSVDVVVTPTRTLRRGADRAR